VTPKQFQKYLDRDQVCCHCGTTETLVPNHRRNRGMGGSKERDIPSNIVVICAEFNGLIESNATLAKLAKDYGWKLTAGQDSTKVPVLMGNDWYLLDDDYGKTRLSESPDNIYDV